MNWICCNLADWASDWADNVWDLADCFAPILLIPSVVIIVVILVGFLAVLALMIFRRSPRQVKKCGPLRLERCPNRRRKLLQDFTVTIGEGKRAIPVTVEKGFETDYSSIPPGFRWAMRWSKVDVAGVVHDWLYANAKNLRHCGKMTKLETDRIWRDIAMSGDHHANRWQATVGWLSLVLFGWIVWNRYKTNPPVHLLPKMEERMMQMDMDLLGRYAAYETVLEILLARLPPEDIQEIRNIDPMAFSEQQIQQLGVWGEPLAEARRISSKRFKGILDAAEKRRPKPLS